MSAAVLKAIRIAAAFINDLLENGGEGVIKIVFAGIAVITLLMLLFIIPVAIFERVPVVKHNQALWYYNAAKEVTQMTQSPCDDGVYVDWQEVIAIDAVRKKQNYKKSSARKAKDLAMNFVEEYGTCTH